MSHDQPPEGGQRKIKWSGMTDRGRIRKNNEDSFLGLQFDGRELWHLGKIGETSLETCDAVFAVSDGMGGATAGEFASRVAVDKIAKLLPKSFRQAAVGLEAGFADVLTQLFHEIHRALVYLGLSYPEDCAGMGATLSLCWFTPEWMYFAHIGDSRIYYLPVAGGIRQISNDDTHVGWLYRQGMINEREARSHPRRTVLQKALGADHRYVDPQVGAVGYDPGDRFLLCTDGLVDGIFNSRLEDMVRTAASKSDVPVAQQLVRVAVEQAGKDNATAMVIEVCS